MRRDYNYRDLQRQKRRQASIARTGIIFVVILIALAAALSQCARPADAGAASAPASAPPCRMWRDGTYRRLVMRRAGDMIYVTYVLCKRGK